MDLSFCHMHGPEHHVMAGAALLVAYKNSGGDIDLSTPLAKEPFSLSQPPVDKKKLPVGGVFCFL